MMPDDEQDDAALVEDDPGDVEGDEAPTMRTPRVMERAMAPRRRVMFMAWESIEWRVAGGQWCVVSLGKLVWEVVWIDGMR